MWFSGVWASPDNWLIYSTNTEILVCAGHCFGCWGSAVRKLDVSLFLRNLHSSGEDKDEEIRSFQVRKSDELRNGLQGGVRDSFMLGGQGRPLWRANTWADSWTIRMTQPCKELGKRVLGKGSEELPCSRDRKETSIGLKWATRWSQRSRKGTDHRKP